MNIKVDTIGNYTFGYLFSPYWLDQGWKFSYMIFYPINCMKMMIILESAEAYVPKFLNVVLLFILFLFQFSAVRLGRGFKQARTRVKWSFLLH